MGEGRRTKGAADNNEASASACEAYATKKAADSFLNISPNSKMKMSCACCRYCGAVLNPAFYFCLRCATAYKAVELVSGWNAYKPVESERIRQKAPNVWPVFWSYACVVFIAGLLQFLLGDDENARLYSLITGTALMFVLTAYFEAIYWRSLVVQLKRFGLFSKAALLSYGLLPLFLIVNFVYHYVFIGSFTETTGIYEFFNEAGLGTTAQLILICVFPAITEEIAFRGLIQHWLQTAIVPQRALLLASALFAGIHLSVLSAPYLFAVGYLLGWVKWKTQSLYPSMLLHFVHNAAVIFVFPLLMS